MKKKMIAFTGIIMMVMFFLADVRFNAEFHGAEEEASRSPMAQDDLARISESNVFGIMGILLQTWARSMRNFFRARTKEI